ILSEAKDLSPGTEILRFAQDDRAGVSWEESVGTRIGQFPHSVVKDHQSGLYEIYSIYLMHLNEFCAMISY
ncbi:MAG: hypothetical protein ACRDIV_26580, partial [Ktedonobacteraceae bacterium]